MRSLLILFLFAATLPAVAQPAKTKPGKAKPDPSATPRPASEKVSWEKAAAIADPVERVSAINKFLEAFPRSTRRSEAVSLLVTTRAEIAAANIKAGDVVAAGAELKAAASEAPKPIPAKLWTETISKFPGDIYFRGGRDDAIVIAKTLEEKAEANADQLLALANFYISIENGTEAKRVAEKAIAIQPSLSAYQTLGVANRVDFDLDAAAAAFQKALELDPESVTAKRGLAEMKRSLGKPEEAATLYREILAKEEANAAARTGLVLSLFDADKRPDAEAEMAKLVEANQANFLLLAGAAYWYAAHNDGEKAVDLGQKAVAAEPRFIWSHIALARGLMLQQRNAEAEKTLMSARRYGNFPTLEFEIASARLAGGYYRDAADALVKSFSIKDGVVQTKLGGRISRESANIVDLVGVERKASINAPTPAVDPVAAAKLTALLALRQELDAAEPNAAAIEKTVDAFVSGDDKMKVHRQIYAASQLLEKKIGLPKVLDLMRAASGGVDAALDDPNAATAVMASEVYEARSISASRGEYVIVPGIPRPTLSSIMRGRIEDISGWTQFQLDNSAEAVVRLRRAVGVLPADSAWWRTSMWRLGSALAATGKESEALDSYIKAYKSAASADPLNYRIIEAIYKRLNGSTDGLEAKIGPDPSPRPVAVVETPAPEPSPTPTPEKLTEPAVLPTPSTEPVTGKLPSAETKTCSVTASEETITLSAKGLEIAVIVGIDEGDLDALAATASSQEDITIRREAPTGVRSKAIFVVSSPTGKAGSYTINFEMPCGKKEISVIVK